MRPYQLANLSDAALIRDLKDLVARDRALTAALLAHIGEVDYRRLYAPAGYPSMYAYCVEELRLSEGATYKRITAARAARRYPILLTLVAEGRLHLTAIKFLAPHLTPANAEEVLRSAAGLGKSELEAFLARRFPDPLAPAPRLAIPVAAPVPQLIPAQSIEGVIENASQLVPEPVGVAASEGAESATSNPGPDLFAGLSVPAPVAPAPRFVLQVAIEAATRDKLHYLQTLLSHSIPSGDVAQVLDRALDALIAQVEKRKFGATARPQARARKARAVAVTRRIPAAVRREVWKRDQGRCTFLGETRQRCASRSFLEFDHIEPVARGGVATVDNLRLRCRAHNQYEAERVFGAEFMAGKRIGGETTAGESPPKQAPLRSSQEESPPGHEAGA